MPGLTAEQKKRLDDLVTEYGLSLTRSEDEKLKRAAMEDTALTMQIKKSHFRALAKAVWQDNYQLALFDLNEQLDLFGLYAVEEKSSAFRPSAVVNFGG